MRRKVPWGSKRRRCHPIIGDAKAPIGLWAGIHLGKELHTHAEEGPRAGQVWKKKPGNWPKVNKDLEELSYINDLTASLLHSSLLGGRPHPFSPGVYLCLPSALNKLFLCVLSHLLCCVSNNKPRTCFYSFCLLETFLLSNGGKSQGKFASNLWPLLV